MISIENHDTDFVIELDLGNTCNYKCNYCFPGANEGTVRWPNIDQLETALLKYIKQHDRPTRLYLIGGEPTLWKHLPRLCNTLKMAHDIKICLSTNASQSLGWWRRHWHCFDVVHISLHHESGDPAHCRAVAELLYDYRVETNIDVLMDPEHFGHCKRLVDAVVGVGSCFQCLLRLCCMTANIAITKNNLSMCVIQSNSIRMRIGILKFNASQEPNSALTVKHTQTTTTLWLMI